MEDAKTQNARFVARVSEQCYGMVHQNSIPCLFPTWDLAGHDCNGKRESAIRHKVPSELSNHRDRRKGSLEIVDPEVLQSGFGVNF